MPTPACHGQKGARGAWKIGIISVEDRFGWWCRMQIKGKTQPFRPFQEGGIPGMVQEFSIGQSINKSAFELVLTGCSFQLICRSSRRRHGKMGKSSQPFCMSADLAVYK